MDTVMFILFGVVLVKLIWLASISVPRSPMSEYELKRRARSGDKSALTYKLRDANRQDIVSFLRAMNALFLVIFTCLSIWLFDWQAGTLLSVVVAILHGRVASFGFIQKLSHKYYLKIFEPQILKLIKKYPAIFKIIRTKADSVTSPVSLHSQDELLHVIKNSPDALDAHQRKLVLNSFEFADRKVNEIMTDKKSIDFVKKTTMLGPLVLDGLHKTGHSRFPVIDGKIDNVIGILNIQDLVSLKDQESNTAAKTMDKSVYYIRDTDSLETALGVFVKTKQGLLIVINEFRETVGVVSLNDIITAMTGRKIDDDFDQYDNIHAVAKRTESISNMPISRHDI